MALVMIVAGGVTACGGGTARSDAGKGDGAIGPDGPCASSTDAGEPEVPPAVSAGGSVPIDQVMRAYAVARCTYYGRCSSLAAYIVDECIEALSQGDSWTATECATTGAGYICFSETNRYLSPSPALVQAVTAGDIGYDPAQMAVCLQEVSTQACHARGPWESIPACNKAFSCQSGAGGDAGADGGAADGGSNCATPLPSLSYTLDACSGAGDCPGPGSVGGPYCVDGYCTPYSCGLSEGGCQFIADGQPCDSDPPFLGAIRIATPWGTMPAALCAPGRTCKGLMAANALGACAPPADIGEPCAEGAAITGCRIGLVCQCGACRMPPTQGSCVSETCKSGVAYCDVTSNRCVSVGTISDPCSGAETCAPNLICDSSTSTCVTGS